MMPKHGAKEAGSNRCSCGEKRRGGGRRPTVAAKNTTSDTIYNN
jgi:hypothetical protein